MIPVTKSFLPPREDYVALLETIWNSRQLTNHGPLHKQLKRELKDYLQLSHLTLVCNGTVALQIAIKALGLKGEIITTPFSYVATTSSIVWEGCTPIFADIDPLTLCIDPDKIEDAITSRTSAVLATHVYGIPCNVHKIEEIAQKHGLKVIYDAAHTFGIKYQGKSLVTYGDISTLSFHATKLFHTVEGGGIATENDELADRVRYMHNFGHKGTEEFWGLGINGKNSEFHAAMGLCILPYIEEIIAARRQVSEWYDACLAGSGLSKPTVPAGTEFNFAYYPVLFPDEKSLLRTLSALNAADIYPRRYFYPSLSHLPYVESQPTPIADSISPRVACLPLYVELEREQVEQICSIIQTEAQA